MANFPTSLDTWSDKVDNVDTVYAADVNQANNASVALETKIGTGASTPTSGTVLRGTGVGTSAFGGIQTSDFSTNVVDTDGTLSSNSDTRIPSQKAVKTYADTKSPLAGSSNLNTTASLITTLNISPLFSPRGFLINGKIVPTDAAGITLTIKTLAGTDPSATDPVYCRIGDTVRSITAALSISLADGTNWMNAGSTELATKEIDYFAYLVWDSNSSAVALTFARIPYANLVSDFSATTTNEKHCAGYSGFTTTDEVENIGRFAATLSAGAGYTWSVPTYTAKNLIQRPKYITRWLDWVPTLTGFSANPTNTVYRYQIRNNNIFIKVCQITSGTSNATNFVITAPFTAQTVTNMVWYVVGLGIDNGVISTAYFSISSAGSVITVTYGPASALWTNSGAKRAIGLIDYEI